MAVREGDERDTIKPPAPPKKSVAKPVVKKKKPRSKTGTPVLNDATRAAAERRAKSQARAIARKKRAQAELWQSLYSRGNELRKTLSPKRYATAPSPAVLPGSNRKKGASGDGGPLSQTDLTQYEAIAKARRDAEKRLRLLNEAKKNPKDKRSGRILERLLADARKRQLTSNNNDFDADYVTELKDAYIVYATHVSEKLAGKTGFWTRLEDLVKRDPKTNKIIGFKDLGQVQKILRNPVYLQYSGEYKRLFGGRGKPGQYTTTGNILEEITNSDNQYRYDTVNSLVGNRIATAEKDEDYRLARKIADAWLKQQDPYYGAKDFVQSTGKKWVWNPDERIYEQVPKTVAEEYESKKAIYEAELQRQQQIWQRYNAQQRAEVNFQRVEGTPQLYASSNSADKRQLATDSKYITDSIQLNLGSTGGGGRAPFSDKEKQKIVDSALKAWEIDHRGVYFPSTIGATPGTQFDRRRSFFGSEFSDQPAPNRRTEERYIEARDAAERRFYGLFNSDVPPIWDRLIGAPILGELGDALDTVIGGVGSAIKLSASQISGKPTELIFTDDFWNRKYTGTASGTVDIDALPPALRTVIARRVLEMVKDPEFIKEAMYGQHIYPQMDNYEEHLRKYAETLIGKKIGQEFFETPEGEAWIDEHPEVGNRSGAGFNQGRTPNERERLKDELEGFYDSFKTGHFGDILHGAAQYGVMPFSPDSVFANLAFQVLDPTNLLPLKPWLYPARLRFAQNAIRGKNVVQKPFSGLYNFLRVKEPRLRLKSWMDENASRLKAGESPESVMEDILRATQGIADEEDAIEAASKAFLRKMGFSREEADAAGILNLVEHDVKKMFVDSGHEFEDAAELAKKALAKEAAVKAAEKEASAARIAASQASLDKTEALKRMEHEASTRREDLVREGQLASVSNRLDELPQRAPAEPYEPRPRPTPGTVTPDDIADANRLTEDGRTAYERSAGQFDVRNLRTGYVVHHGYYFPDNDETAKLFRSKYWKTLEEQLEAVNSAGKPAVDVRNGAGAKMHELSRRLDADSILDEESHGILRLTDGRVPWVGKGAGEAGVDIPNPDFPYDVRRAGTDEPYHYVALVEDQFEGGTFHTKQYIADPTDAALRSGVRNEDEAAAVGNLRVLIESLKRRIVNLNYSYKKGYIEREEFLNTLKNDVQRWGMERSDTSLYKDLHEGIGTGVDISTRDMQTTTNRLIEIGERLVQDAFADVDLDIRALDQYYDAFSVLPSVMAREGLMTAFMSRIMDPLFRGLIKPSEVRVMFGVNVKNGVTPTLFRDKGQHLFALFHMTYLSGDIKKMQAFSDTFRRILIEQPDNIYARMWQVMEVRSRVPWIKKYHNQTFANVETAFFDAVLKAGIDLDPNLALGMISFGPFARKLPISYGLPRVLQPLTTAHSKMIGASPSSWGDEDVLKRIAQIVDGDKQPITAIRAATQVIHYISLRYGSTSRRASFNLRRKHGQLENLYALRNDAIFKGFYGDFKERAKEILAYKWSARHHGEVSNPKNIEKWFELEMGRAPRRGMRKTYFPQDEEIIKLFEEMYHAGELSHKNPGLHTLTLIFTLAEPEVQRGEDWADIALSYLRHMSLAGERAKAVEIIRELFPWQRAQVADTAWETIYGSGRRGAAGELTSRQRLFKEAGLLPDYNQAESAAKARRSQSEADILAEEVVEREKWIVTDDTARAASANPESIYIGTNFDDVLYRVETFRDVIKNLLTRRQDIVDLYGPLDLKAIDDVIKAVRAVGRKIGGSRGAARQLKELEKFKSPLRETAEVELRLRGLEERILSDLSWIVTSTLDKHGLSGTAGDQLDKIVEIVAELPNGKRILTVLGERVGHNLEASLLFDRMINLPYMESIEKAAKASGVHGEKTTLLGQITEKIGFHNNAVDFYRGILDKGSFIPPPDGSPYRKFLMPVPPAPGIKRVQLTPELRIKIENRIIKHQELADGYFARHENIISTRPENPRVVEEAGGLTDDLDGAERTMTGRALKTLTNMTPQAWLNKELHRMRRIRDGSAGAAAKSTASRRIEDIENALRMITIREHGGTFVRAPKRAAFVRRIVAAGSARARAVFPSQSISTFLFTSAGANIELARALNIRRVTSRVDESLGKVEMLGDVSQHYVHHGDTLDKLLDRPIPKTLLEKSGFGDSLKAGGDVSALDLITDAEEFLNSRRNPDFKDFMDYLHTRVQAQLYKVTGDMNYTVAQYLSDRVVHRDDFYDAVLFEKHERQFAAVIAAARGWTRDTLTSLRRIDFDDSLPVTTEMIDRDIRVVVAKARLAKELGVSIHSYNEMRKVMGTPLSKRNTGLSIYAQASEATLKTLEGRGLSVNDVNWDKEWAKLHGENFKAIREEIAGREADKMLEALAGKMQGARVENVISQFEDMYTLSQDVKGFEQMVISPFQNRSLEKAINHYAQIDDLHDTNQLVEGLSKFGQAPPFENRSKMREWLVYTGFWSPRTGEAIDSGKVSWDIFKESDFFMAAWGRTPPWADPTLIEKGGLYHDMVHTREFWSSTNRLWGVFDRNMIARLKTGGLSRELKSRILVEGDLELGIHPKRDIDLERRYVIQRLGRIVSDDGQTLKAMPWLMNQNELRAYMIQRAIEGATPYFVKTPEHLDALAASIAKHLGKRFDELIKGLGGKPASRADMLNLAASVTADIMANPAWLKRSRDNLGDFINLQAATRRAMVFTQPGFGFVNMVDTQLKGVLMAWDHKSFRALGGISKEAGEVTLLHAGLEYGTQLLRHSDRYGTHKMRHPRGGFLRGLDFLVGFSETPAQFAGHWENDAKLRFLQNHYDEYKRVILEDITAAGHTGDAADALAKAATLNYLGKEAARLWPTVGDGPIEKLFNALSPFMSYQFKNHRIFIGELAAHPVLFNWMRDIGDYIEAENRKRWAEERPHDALDERTARLIELPWAPGVFIDFGRFSDAQRGWDPALKLLSGKMQTWKDFIAPWVRLAGPNDINIVGGILNAFHIYGTSQWFRNEDGTWEKRLVPWENPWGEEADVLSSLWGVDLARNFFEMNEGGLTIQEITQLAFQAMFFGGLITHDKGAGLQSYYYALKDQNPAAAKDFLNTPDGDALKYYWLNRDPRGYNFHTEQSILDIINPSGFQDTNPWFHSKDPAFQTTVKQGFEDLKVLRKKWDDRIWDIDPWTQEYRDAKLGYSNERFQYYVDHPEMYEWEMFTMTPSQWASHLDDLKLDDLMQAYFDLKAPLKSDFPDTAKGLTLYQKKLAEWRKSRMGMIDSFPQIGERLSSIRTSFEAVWKDHEAGWQDIYDKVGEQDIAIHAAQEAENFELSDQLYTIQETSYERLNESISAEYFKPSELTETEWRRGDGGGYTGFKTAAVGALKHFKVMPSSSTFRYMNFNPAELAQFERDLRYADNMKEVIAKAKLADSFGASFVKQIKNRPWLKDEYFRRHEGKREEWARNDDYLKQIGVYGRTMKAGKFAEAGRYFENLPHWVRAKYFEINPEKKGHVQETIRYMGFMGNWVSFYKRNDPAGAAEYFNNMPSWVKEKYYAAHPDKRGTIGTGDGNFSDSPYSRAMGKWVRLLRNGKKDEAKAWFDSMPKEFKERYYGGHPEARIRDNIKRVGQMGQYFGANDAGRIQFLKDNPSFAKWLASQGTGKQTRRMLVMAAYKALPPDDTWLRRVFREKYPDIFSVEAAGEARLARVNSFLDEHPEYGDSFSKWVEIVMASYSETLKHTASRPKPITFDHSRQRQHGVDRWKPRRGRSAAWVRLHSLS